MARYKIEVDTHTHTIISGHAFSTLHENLLQAKKVGLKGLCLTEHSSALPGSGPYFLTRAFVNLPQSDEGVRIYRGIEADIISPNGTIVPEPRYTENLDFCIASIHDVTPYAEHKVSDYTQTYVNVVKNPYITAIGHIDRGKGTCDFETVILAAKENGKLIEINNSSLNFTGSHGMEKMESLISLCKKHECPVCVSSDSHYYTTIGEFGIVLSIMEKLDFPEELIMNRTKEVFEAFVEKHKEKIASL